MTWNGVKRLANRIRVNCLFDVIGQSDMLSLFATEKKMCLRHRGLLIRYVELVRSRGKNVRRAQRTVKNEEDKTSFSLGRSAESFVVSLQSDQLAQPEGTVNASKRTFSRKQVQEREDWGGSTTGPGAAETAASFMGLSLIHI